MQKKETGQLSHTIYKNKLKMDEDLDVRLETTKIVEQNIDNKLFDISLSNSFLWTSILKKRQQKLK